MSLPSLSESPATLKRCTKCGIEKPVAEFGRASSHKDGLNPWCKACKAAYYQANREKIIARRSAYHQANPEKRIAQQAAYRKANPEKIAARHAAYRKANREKIIAYHAAYRKANPEKVAARKAAWEQANRERIVAYHDAYRKANREKIIAYHAAYHQANPEKSREHRHKRRARKRNASGTHTAQQIKDLVAKQRSKCAYCKSSIKKKYHIDHIIALANGGSNDITNVQLLCPSCNCKKQDRDPVRFAQQMGLLL